MKLLNKSIFFGITLILTSFSAMADIKAVATIKPIHSLLASVMEGVGTPSLIVEGSNSPHNFTLKPSHATMLEEADIIFWVGEDLELFLEKPLESLAKDAKKISLLELPSIQKLKFRESNIHDEHHGHEDEHEGHDDEHHGHEDEHEGHDDEHHGHEDELEGHDDEHHGHEDEHEGHDDEHHGHEDEHEGHDDEHHGHEDEHEGHDDEHHGHEDEHEGHDDEHHGHEDEHEGHDDEHHGHEDEHEGHDDEHHGHEDELEGHDDEHHGHEDEHEGHDDEHHGHEDEHEEDDKNHDEHMHGEFDAHVWLDPMNAQAIVLEMAHELSKIDSTNKDIYELNAQKLTSSLDALMERANQIIPEKPSFIVFHDAYQYFENRFGIRSEGALTLNPDVLPGAKQIAEIQELIEHENVKCIFSEPQYNPKIIEVLAEDMNVSTGIIDPLGASIDKGPSMYNSLILDIANSLEDCS